MTQPLPQDRAPVAHWTTTDWAPYIQTRLVDGRRVRFLDYGSGPVLVLLHGMGASWQWWLENIPTLAADHRVIAVDLPGFGHSEPLPAPAEMSAHADTVFDLLGQLDIRSATIVGHSMGGLVALTMANADREVVRSLVLVGAGGVPMTERHLSIVLAMLRVSCAVLRRRFLRNALATKPWVRRLLLGVAFHDTAALSNELAAQTMPLLNAPGFVDAVAAAGRAVRDAVPETITCPVLLVWGRHDPLAPVHCAEDMHRRLADSQLVILPDAGHTPLVERPDEFNAAVLSFTTARGY